MNTNLEKALAKPMNHISNVKDCFEYCSTKDDIEEVIRRIPNMFGAWDVYYSENDKTFVVTNFYVENGENYEDEEEYEFYTEEDLEEELLDEMYHDCSEDELRKMGCFDNLNEEDN